MTRVLVHLVLHCVFSTRIEPLKVTRSACVCAHARNMSFTACNAHLRCANQVIVRILLLPSENTMNAPNVHKCTSARSPSMAKRTLRMTFMACQGSKVKLWGVPVPDQARPTQCALFGPKVKKCARTCPALTTAANPSTSATVSSEERTFSPRNENPDSVISNSEVHFHGTRPPDFNDCTPFALIAVGDVGAVDRRFHGTRPPENNYHPRAPLCDNIHSDHTVKCLELVFHGTRPPEYNP